MSKSPPIDSQPSTHGLPWSRRRRWLVGGGLGLLTAAGGACFVGCAVTSHVDHDGPNAPHFEPFAKRFKLALVLSSGGPRGFVHIGVLKGLAQLGIQPDLIVGSSVGALVGAMAASGLGALHMEQLALNLGLTDMAKLNLLGEGRFSGTALADWVNGQVEDRATQQLPTAFAAVAVGQKSREVVVFNRGNLGLACQASAAIEGQFSPVTIRGQRYVDGDLVLPMPVRLAKSLGAAKVLAIDASAHEDKAPERAVGYRTSDLRKRALTAPDAAAADITLHPEFGYWVSASREFKERAIAAGLADTLAAAERLKAL